MLQTLFSTLFLHIVINQDLQTSMYDVLSCIRGYHVHQISYQWSILELYFSSLSFTAICFKLCFKWSVDGVSNYFGILHNKPAYLHSKIFSIIHVNVVFYQMFGISLIYNLE